MSGDDAADDAARRGRALDLNAQLATWIADTAHQRVVPGDPAGRRVAEALGEEQRVLLARPAHSFPCDLVQPPLRQDAVHPLRRQRLLDPA